MYSQRIAPTLIVVLSMVVAARISPAIPAAQLPLPTGNYPVGRTNYLWFDAARSGRPVRVDFWYPAEPGKSLLASYRPDFDVLLKNPTTRQGLEHEFGPHLSDLEITTLRSSAYESAGVARSGRPFPVVLFSHGLGICTYDYTIQLEDLASHGYIIAAVEHINDSLGVILSDQKVVPFDGALWKQYPASSSASEETAKFYQARAKLWAEDLLFVLNQLSFSTATEHSFPHGTLDFSRAGVFGHSHGGRSAATACLLDERIKACLNEDGRMGDCPYWPIAGHHIHGVFAMLDWFDSGFNEEDFVVMHTDLKTYAQSKVNAVGPALEAYNSVDGGSYHLTMLQSGMSHLAFTDIELLTARSDASRLRSTQCLLTIRQIVREFFDQTLKGVPSHLLNFGSVEDDILLQCHQPAQTRVSK